MNDNITKLNMVIKTLESDIEERKNLNLLAKKAIADAKKKIKALEKLEAKEKEIIGNMFNNDACPTRDEEDCDCDCEPIYHRPYEDTNRICGEECDCNTCDIPVID